MVGECSLQEKRDVSVRGEVEGVINACITWEAFVSGRILLGL